MKKPIVLGLILVASLTLLATPAVLGWQMSPSGDYWYINAQYVDDDDTGPLVIKLNGESSAGQIFLVGDTVIITVSVSAVAQSAAGGYQEVFTNATLEVNGPSGFAFDMEWDDVWNNGDEGIEINQTAVPVIVTITYPLTEVGTHEVYANSYAAVAQGSSDVGDETVDALLTFEVRLPTKAEVLQGNGVPGKGIEHAPGLQKAVPNDNFAKGKAK